MTVVITAMRIHRTVVRTVGVYFTSQHCRMLYVRSIYVFFRVMRALIMKMNTVQYSLMSENLNYKGNQLCSWNDKWRHEGKCSQIIICGATDHLQNDTLCYAVIDINTKNLQFNKYCKGGPVKASKQQKSLCVLIVVQWCSDSLCVCFVVCLCQCFSSIPF